MARTLPVLMYHSVPDGGAGGPLAVPRRLVARQWSALREQGWRLLGLTEALRVARADPAARVVGLTFDDGYADFLPVVQLLVDHDAAATLYLPTAHIGGAGGLPGVEGRLATWEEIASLPPDRVELGCHAHVHRPLDVLGEQDLRAEVETSRRVLHEAVGALATSFCYPHGYADRRVRAAVAAAGFDNACVVGRRLADPRGAPLAVPRLQVLPGHDEAGIRALVTRGEAGPAPLVKHYAAGPWRVARRTVYRTTGRVLT